MSMSIGKLSSCPYWNLEYLNLHTDLRYANDGLANQYRNTLRVVRSRKLKTVTSVNVSDYSIDIAASGTLQIKVNGGTAFNITTGSQLSDLYLLNHYFEPLGEQGTGFVTEVQEWIAIALPTAARPGGWATAVVDWQSATTAAIPVPTYAHPADDPGDLFYLYESVRHQLDLQSFESNENREQRRSGTRVVQYADVQDLSSISGLDAELMRESAIDGGFNEDFPSVEIVKNSTYYGNWILTDWEVLPIGGLGGKFARIKRTFESAYKWIPLTWERS